MRISSRVCTSENNSGEERNGGTGETGSGMETAGVESSAQRKTCVQVGLCFKHFKQLKC